MLAYLVRHRERVVPKDELLRVLWPDAVVTDASLQRAVSLARRALLPADRRLLRTYARHGYRFVGEVAGGDAMGWAAPLPAPRYVRRGEVHVAYRTIGQGPIDVVIVLGWSLSMRSALELSGAELLYPLRRPRLSPALGAPQTGEHGKHRDLGEAGVGVEGQRADVGRVQ